MFALTTFAIGNNELRGLLLAHLVSAGGSGARLAKAYAYPLFPKDESGLDMLQVNRKEQADAKNTTKMMADFYESQRGGMLPDTWAEIGGPSGDVEAARITTTTTAPTTVVSAAVVALKYPLRRKEKRSPSAP